MKGLLAGHQLSAREVARRSELIAEDSGKPHLAFGHQAVSSWVNGTRHPNAEHKAILSTIFEIPLAEFNQGCDGDAVPIDVQSRFKPMTVSVRGTIQDYQYRVALRADLDLTQPAVYKYWTDMFSIFPTYLMRHFRRMKYELFGWIPDSSASPLVHYPRCLVPLEGLSKGAALSALDKAESSQRRVWFVYLPGGKLQVGIGCRERRWFSFARNNEGEVVIQKYPLSRVELLGYFTGKALFHVLSAPKLVASQSHGVTAKEEKASGQLISIRKF